MSEQNGVKQLYADFCRFINKTGDNSFSGYFQNAVRSAPGTLSIFEKYMERRVDMEWVEIMEKTIVPIDNIIRKPNSFIKREEDIIPIAQAHNVGPESVRHLAQHTSLISSVKNGVVTPSRILNVTKDDSLETYENRFIYTLIKQASYFLDKRLRFLLKDSKVADQFSYHVDGNCNVGVDKFTYNLDMSLESPHEDVADDALINADISNMTPLQRIERLRKIFYTFQASMFFRNLSSAADVRPPLVLTNVLKKNPNFISAVALWNFINSYTKAGYSIEDVETFRTPTEEDKVELYALIMLQYAIAKKRGAVANEDANALEKEEAVQVATPPSVVRNAIDSLCDTFDLSVDEVRRIYEQELKKKEKKRGAEYARIRGIFERALETERVTDRNAEIHRHNKLQAEFARRLAKAQETDTSVETQGEENERGFEFLYRYSFMARLIQSGKPLQTYYSELKNYLLSYQKVKGRMTWGYERFSLGKAPIVKISGRGKTLTLVLALPESVFSIEKYRLKDLRVEGKENAFTAKFRVTSDRALKYAKELIALCMVELCAEQSEIPTVAYEYAYQSTDRLLKSNPPLVKRVDTAARLRDRKFAEAGNTAANGRDFDELQAFNYKYRYSFSARLIQSGEPLQTYYTEIKNHLLSYKKAKAHMSWGYERFSIGKENILRMKGKCKSLMLLMVLPEEVLRESKYHLKDMRTEGAEAAFNAKFRVASDRALKYAKELIDVRMKQLGIEQGEVPEVDYRRAYQSTAKLLKANPPLIKSVDNSSNVTEEKTEPKAVNEPVFAVGEIPVESEPVAEAAPVMEETSAEEKSVAEVAPVAEETPTEEETPAVEQPSDTESPEKPDSDAKPHKNIASFFGRIFGNSKDDDINTKG